MLGNRSLRDNLEVPGKTTMRIDPSNVHQSLKESEEVEEEIPDQLEEIIEILLSGLRNRVYYDYFFILKHKQTLIPFFYRILLYVGLLLKELEDYHKDCLKNLLMM